MFEPGILLCTNLLHSSRSSQFGTFAYLHQWVQEIIKISFGFHQFLTVFMKKIQIVFHIPFQSKTLSKWIPLVLVSAILNFLNGFLFFLQIIIFFRLGRKLDSKNLNLEIDMMKSTVKRGNSDHFSTLSLNSAMTDWFVNLQYAPIS